MEYRYSHFTRELMQDDSSFRSGPEPGDPLPEFDLPTAGGGRIRTADLLGRPFLLTLASYT